MIDAFQIIHVEFYQCLLLKRVSNRIMVEWKDVLTGN